VLGGGGVVTKVVEKTTSVDTEEREAKRQK
jgi:hypothetical protein